MDNLNFGSGNQLLGNQGGALQEAVARRNSGDASQMSVQSPASAGYDASQTQQQMSSAGAPQGGMAMSQGQALGAPQQLNTAMENDLIIKALSTKLKQNTVLEHSQSGVVK